MAAAAEHRKRSKYSHLNATNHFISIAVESLGGWARMLDHSFGILLSASRQSMKTADLTNSSFSEWP